MGIVIAVLAIALVAVCFVLNAKHRGELLSAGVILQRQRDFVEYADTFTLATISNEQFAAAVETANLTAGTASKMQGNSGRIDFQAGVNYSAVLYRVEQTAEKSVYCFKFTKWRSQHGAPVCADAMNTLLTSVEKMFLGIDPNTQVTTVKSDIKTKRHLF